jgi:hypothetical protein
LASIVDDRRTSPSVEPTAFPNTSTNLSWSSTPWGYSATPGAYGVIFATGQVGGDVYSGSDAVRCVRREP